MSTARIHLGPLNPTQRQLLEWRPPPDATKVLMGLLSAGYGSGKTWGSAVTFADRALRIRPWQPEQQHRQRPKALVVSVTHANLRSNVLPMLDRLLGPAIVSKRVTPTPTLSLRNGVEVEVYSLKSLVEGMSCQLMWVDEATHGLLLDRPATWRNLWDRLRGFPGETKTMIVSGIAAMHPVIRERFYRPDDPKSCILMPGIRENRGLDEDTIRSMLEAAPAEAREAVEHGGWIPMRERIYELDVAAHRYDGPIDHSAPVSIGYDPGDQACAVVGQQIGEHFVLVDEVIARGATTEQLIHQVRARGWREIRTVVLDTQASMDSVQAVTDAAPGAYPYQAPKRSAAWSVVEGIEHVQWALRDATGRVRLQIAGPLWDHGHPERGVVRSLTSYRYNGKTGRPVRDNRVDHQCDAVRMLVVAMVERHRERISYADASVEAW